MMDKILAVVMYLTIGGNIFFAAFVAASPPNSLPPWVIAAVAGMNAVSGALKSDGLHIPGVNAVKAVVIVGMMLLMGSLVSCNGMPPALSQVDAFAVTLGTLETAASAYENQPKADAAVVAKMKIADQQAYLTIKTAEAEANAGASPDLIAVQTALTAFQALVPAQYLQPKAN